MQPQALVVLAEFNDPRCGGVDRRRRRRLRRRRDRLRRARARSIRRGRVYAGYSGWGAGQLEGELAEEAWIVEPPLPAELFPDDPEALWQDVLARKGGQFALIARMPDDPSLN